MTHPMGRGMKQTNMSPKRAKQASKIALQHKKVKKLHYKDKTYRNGRGE